MGCIVVVNGCKLISDMYKHDYTSYAPCKAMGISVHADVNYKASLYKGTGAGV